MNNPAENQRGRYDKGSREFQPTGMPLRSLPPEIARNTDEDPYWSSVSG